MCTHRRYITNPYAKYKRVLVDCGHCPSCLQKKSDVQSQLIRLHSMRSGKVCIFCTLTYSNRCVPYVNVHNFDKCCTELSIWRDSKFMRPKVGDGFNKSYLLYGLFELGRINLSNVLLQTKKNLGQLSSIDCFSPADLAVKESEYTKFVTIKLNSYNHDEQVCCMPLQKKQESIGILYYPDVQLFFNRLRSRYFHKFSKRAEVSYYICGEYGSDTHRPHFHVLLWCSSDDASWFLSNIAACWPYGSRYRTKKYTEIARDCSSYVSKYLNGHTFVSPFLQTFFPPKSSKSVYFAYDCKNYDYWKLLDMFLRGDYEEKFVSNIESPGVSETSVLLPSRVICRFFPRFFGDSTLDDIALRWFIPRPALYSRFLQSRKLDNFDYKKHVQTLSRGFSRYVAATGNNNWDDYTDMYIRVWRNYRSFCLKHSLQFNEQLRVPLLAQFDNIQDVFMSRHRVTSYPLLSGYTDSELNLFRDYNNIPYFVTLDNKRSAYFKNRLKIDNFNYRVYSFNDPDLGL